MVFLFYMWYKLIENFDLNFLFFYMFKEVRCNIRKVTAALQVVRFFSRFSLQDGSLLNVRKVTAALQVVRLKFSGKLRVILWNFKIWQENWSNFKHTSETCKNFELIFRICMNRSLDYFSGKFFWPKDSISYVIP